MVWKSAPPTISGAETADSPDKKVKIVKAKRVGFRVGKTIFQKTVKGLAPIFRAASIV